MAEFTCPICGKDNSEHAAECLYCGAVLNASLGDAWHRPVPESMDDILASLRGGGFTPEPEADDRPAIDPPPAEPPADQTEDLSDSDFMNRLRGLASEEPEAADIQPEAAAESLPDWLKELEGWQPVEAFSTAGEDTTPGADQPVFSIEETALPPWLNVPEAEIPEPEAISDAEPAAEAQPEPMPESEPEPDFSSTAELWTEETRFLADTPNGPDDEPITQADGLPEDEEPDGNLSEWLAPHDQNLPEMAFDPLMEPTEPARLDHLPEFEFPPAYPELAGEEPADDEPAAEPLPAEDEKPLPEWLQGVRPAEDAPEYPGVKEVEYPGDAQSISASEADNLNEWLGNLQAENFPLVFDLGGQRPAGAEAQPADDDEGEITAPMEEAAVDPSLQLPATPPFVNGDLSAWLPTEPEQKAAEAQDKVPADENQPADALPAWMQDITPENTETQPAEGVAQKTVDETIPEWLAGLKPVSGDPADAQQAQPQDAVETSGPLAGIPGVLPIIHAAASFRKAPVYSDEVLVSEKQAAHAARLETLVAEESQPARKKRAPRRAPFGLFRTGVGLLLVAVMLLPLLPPVAAWWQTAAPQFAAPEAALSAVPAADGFRSAIEGLAEEATVLVAVEYTAGYAGELTPAASAILQMLMEQNARIAMITTNPSGLLLAEGLKNDALNAQSQFSAQYTQRDWLINLGYLPGETLSLQELASNLPQAVQYGISAGLENRPVWDSAGLLEIYSLEDFSMLILITDTAESGRAWMEQVQPAIPQVPLLMAVSAQAAPMLQPYVDSGQAQAMITGLTGGWALDPAGANPVMFRLGIAVVVSLLLIGAALEGLRAVFGRKQMD